MELVGARGFEPRTSCAQGKRATRLRHAPTYGGIRRHAAGQACRRAIPRFNHSAKLRAGCPVRAGAGTFRTAGIRAHREFPASHAGFRLAGLLRLMQTYRWKCMRAGVRPGLQILWTLLCGVGRFDSDSLPPEFLPRILALKSQALRSRMEWKAQPERGEKHLSIRRHGKLRFIAGSIGSPTQRAPCDAIESCPRRNQCPGADV